MIRGSLQRKLTLGLITYLLLLSIAVAAHGVFVNESVEALIWESLLQSEFAHFHERLDEDPGYRWTDTELLQLYGRGSDAPIPAAFDLPAGVHDEIGIGARQFIAMVDGTGSQRSVMALDITEMERAERTFIRTIFASSALIATLLVLATFFGVRRLVRPLAHLARDIDSLSPDHNGQRVMVEKNAPREAQVIAQGLNAYLQRNDEYVERERKFIRMASHELRTPIAALIGTAEVAIDQRRTSAAEDPQLQRILDTAHEMQDTVAMLLVLARDPARLRAMMEPTDLADIVAHVVDSHMALATAKQLTIQVVTADVAALDAPRQIVAATIANLLRNAIENSELGNIAITVTGSQVMIEDPGHGVSEHERARLYTQRARDGAHATGGIGLELISRACAHLGWQLAMETLARGGTRATLTFRPAP